MTQSCPTFEVVAAVQRVMEVNRKSRHLDWLAVPYDVVAAILRDQYGHSSDESHALIFEAVMSGHVTIEMSKLESTDRTEQLCIERKGQDA